MPLITVSMYPGRTQEQKTNMQKQSQNQQLKF